MHHRGMLSSAVGVLIFMLLSASVVTGVVWHGRGRWY
jgi:hypothetical protein